MLEDIIPRNFVKIFQERSVFLYHSRWCLNFWSLTFLILLLQVEGQQCVNIPVQTCSNVPVQAPVEVPKEKCYKRPRKVCQTLVSTKPKIITAQVWHLQYFNLFYIFARFLKSTVPMTLLSSLVLPQLHQPLVHWWNHPHHLLQCRLFQEATTLTPEQVLNTPMMMMVDLSVLVMTTTPEMMRSRRISGTLEAIRKIYSSIWWTRSLTK